MQIPAVEFEKGTGHGFGVRVQIAGEQALAETRLTCDEQRSLEAFRVEEWQEELRIEVVKAFVKKRT